MIKRVKWSPNQPFHLVFAYVVVVAVVSSAAKLKDFNKDSMSEKVIKLARIERVEKFTSWLRYKGT